MHNLMNNL